MRHGPANRMVEEGRAFRLETAMNGHPPTPWLNCWRAIWAPLMAAFLLGACSTVNLSPGVNFYGTDLGIERKADGAEAVYASDTIKGEFSFYVVSDDFVFAEDAPGIGGTSDTWGVNFLYQAPTAFRSEQKSSPVRATVKGVASYFAVFLVDKFTVEDRASKLMAGLVDRMFIGMGIGRITINGEADFYLGDTATTPIDTTDNSAFVYFLGWETRKFLGVENLIFRATLAEYIFDDEHYEFLVGGVVFTIGYKFGLNIFGDAPGKNTPNN